MEQNCIICNKPMRTHLVLNNINMLQCDTCKLIRKETFDMSIEHYESLDSEDNDKKRLARKRNSLDRIRILSKFVPINDWCDIGTGEGIFLETLSEMGGSGVGIEPSRSSCLKAKNHGVSIVGNSLEDIGSVTKENTVKVVSLFHVIEHLENPDKAITDIYHALPSGGYLIIETPNINSWLFKACNYKNKLIYPEHLWYFSPQTLRNLLLKNNFHIVASGKRDFDQYNLPIKESLYRLSILPKVKVSSEFPTFSDTDKQINKDETVKDSTVRTIIRSSLSRAVTMTGRLQYMYFVVQKR